MLVYRQLTDDALLLKMQAVADAIEKAALGDEIAVIAGEGRRMEVTRSNLGEARNLYDLLEGIWFERYPDQAPVRGGRAISVTIV